MEEAFWSYCASSMISIMDCWRNWNDRWWDPTDASRYSYEVYTWSNHKVMLSKMIQQDNLTSQDHSKQIQLDLWKLQDLWSHSLGVSRLANVAAIVYQVEISCKSLQSTYGPELGLRSWHSFPAMSGSQWKTWTSLTPGEDRQSEPFVP